TGGGRRPMTMPFYVSPEQVMKDRADYARKGIARGRSLIALEAADGIVIVAENPSRTLFKISEIYDHIAFAGVGKYNEFEMLKIAGVRHADLKGYAYSREDVAARPLANAYAQTLGQVFTHEMKPYEVEILVAQVGDTPESDEMFHILYDGTVMDEEGHTVLGGQADTIADTLENRYQPGLSVDDAIRLGASVLSDSNGQPLSPDQLEVGVLQRGVRGRAFRRVKGEERGRLLAAGAANRQPRRAYSTIGAAAAATRAATAVPRAQAPRVLFVPPHSRGAARASSTSDASTTSC